MNQMIGTLTFMMIAMGSQAQMLLKSEKPIKQKADRIIFVSCRDSARVMHYSATELLLRPEMMFEVIDSTAEGYHLGFIDTGKQITFDQYPDCPDTDPRYNVLLKVKPSMVVTFEEISKARQKVVAMNVLKVMLDLCNQYSAASSKSENYDEGAGSMDVIYYQKYYKPIENLINDICLEKKDLKMYRDIIRINIANYYYNGDSGEGYYTFSRLFFSHPEMMVAMYRKCNFKASIEGALSQSSLMTYAASYWPHMMFGKFPELRDVHSDDRENFAKYASEKYQPFLDQIKPGMRFNQ